MIPHRWQLRRAQPHGADVDLVARWMAQPHVEEFWQQAWEPDRWAKEIAEQLAGDHSVPCVALLDGEPVAYLELYRVCRDRIAALYPAGEHDLGVHIAIGESDRTGRGLGRSLLRAVADGLLAANPACRRVIAEPDVRNVASVRAFTAAGFQVRADLTLPHKTATLLIYPRTGPTPAFSGLSGVIRVPVTPLSPLNAGGKRGDDGGA
ncbi:MAG TPA: GNAT family N-acetyltransferase [Pseudonocardiaceae bacterium]